MQLEIPCIFLMCSLPIEAEMHALKLTNLTALRDVPLTLVTLRSVSEPFVSCRLDEASSKLLLSAYSDARLALPFLHRFLSLTAILPRLVVYCHAAGLRQVRGAHTRRTLSCCLQLRTRRAHAAEIAGQLVNVAPGGRLLGPRFRYRRCSHCLHRFGL